MLLKPFTEKIIEEYDKLVDNVELGEVVDNANIRRSVEENLAGIGAGIGAGIEPGNLADMPVNFHSLLLLLLLWLMVLLWLDSV